MIVLVSGRAGEGKSSFAQFCIDYLKDVGFRTLNLYKLYTETYAFRYTHIRYLEECGMVQEGVLKEHVFINA